MFCVYDGLEPYNHYEPQQDTNNPNPPNICFDALNRSTRNDYSRPWVSEHAYFRALFQQKCI
jgi:hypothetical protein